MTASTIRNFRRAGACALALTISTAALAAPHARRVAPWNLANYWTWVSASPEAYVPNSGKNLHVPVCASVRYTIGSDGVVRNATLGKVVPDSDLGQSAVKVVSHFRYVAGPGNAARQPIDTYYTVQFNMRSLSSADKQRLMKPCELPGYGD